MAKELKPGTRVKVDLGFGPDYGVIIDPITYRPIEILEDHIMVEIKHCKSSVGRKGCWQFHKSAISTQVIP